MRIDRDGKTERLAADHVIAATGFRTDVRRMGFLSAALLPRLDTAHHAPALSSQFELTVPGTVFRRAGVSEQLRTGDAIRPRVPSSRPIAWRHG